MASSLDHNHTLNGDSNTQQWPPPPAIIGLGASNSTPQVGFFRHSNPKLGEQLLYFILSSLRGPIQSAKLINVGQKQDALQSLHDLITSKRYRAWQKPLEKIMFKYVELCVDLRKGRFAKDGLIQYRIICQQVNVSSLEEVIKHFMHLSTEKAEQARTQAQALEEALDVDDLEADKRPEDLMLSYVSGEKGKDRSDREVVTPWFKFLWETYRTVLEILRNNSKLEALYATRAASHLELENEKERNLRMANLIGFNLDPKIDRGDVLSRSALLSELVSKDSSHSQVNDETLHRADERSGRVHPTVDVAEIIRRWTHTLQRIHKQSLHMAKANEGEGPEILRSAHEGSSSGHAEPLAATLAEHQQHLVSFQVLINQLKEVAPAIQKSISEWTDKVDSISSNLPPMTKHPGQMEKVTIKAL
ncbi:hypothetical protein RchiOBHm_Chr5g0047251 [Rosa chinensis]|uniref:eIF3a PCI domain-containing protein n=1 Tax=Rosa chinensis TaxID=74649 RepID=A0A2P6QEA1_ROSCH|nr:hypothetical protein RchiOBHm_Chr5g0047251 [Rosa chinensis]